MNILSNEDGDVLTSNPSSLVPYTSSTTVASSGSPETISDEDPSGSFMSDKLVCGQSRRNSSDNISIRESQCNVLSSLPPPLEMEVHSGNTPVLDGQRCISGSQLLDSVTLRGRDSGNIFGCPTVNATLASQNHGKVIIISVIDENAINLLTNPFKINALFTRSISPFKDVTIKDSVDRGERSHLELRGNRSQWTFRP